VKLTKCDLGDRAMSRGNGCTILWMDGHTGKRWVDDDLEVISASR
jgi:prepilin-type processing-associated H-X9-DG protein